jgi:hypothetical protein
MKRGKHDVRRRKPSANYVKGFALRVPRCEWFYSWN